MKKQRPTNRLARAVKKFFLSAFVVVTFFAYALENRGTNNPTKTPVTGATAVPQTGEANVSPGAPAGADDPSQAQAGVSPTPAPATQAPASPANPTQAPTATAQVASSNGLKDGTYTGPSINVDWGFVQVQATVQQGKISDVQFVQYPSDRRTSARINSFAVPALEQEAIQAQSANVDLITGATLTSEGFQMSLQAALDQAKG